MAKQILPTDFKDDVLSEGALNRRKYVMISNGDGTVSFDDVTDYFQRGSTFGAAQVNQTNEAVNNSVGYDDIVDNFLSDATDLPASARTVKVLNGKLTYSSGTGNRYTQNGSGADFECVYHKYGRVCVVRFAFTPNKDIPSNNQIIATGLPLPSGTQYVGLPIIDPTGKVERGNLAISVDGNLVNWYGYGLKSGEFVKGGITYITKE